MMTKTMRLTNLCLTLWLGSVALATASSPERSCQRWFAKKKYLQAANCFAQLVGKTRRWKSEQERARIGSWMRNAILALKRSAKEEKLPARASYLRERALKLLQRYLDGQWFMTPSQKRNMLVSRESLKDAIGYTKMTILTGAPNATISVSGFRYEGKGRGMWSQKVRPGTYTILVEYPDKRRQARQIRVQTGRPQLLSQSPPLPASPQGSAHARTAGPPSTTHQPRARRLDSPQHRCRRRHRLRHHARPWRFPIPRDRSQSQNTRRLPG